jgi:hypothetical protein
MGCIDICIAYTIKKKECSIGTSTICARSAPTGSSVRRRSKRFSDDPILVYDQTIEKEIPCVYYGESDVGRLLALVITERGKAIRVITAYDLDAGQKHDYLERRLKQG